MKNTIVILANSVKHGQHCVAGKDIITKRWFRPVSNKDGRELSHEQAKCKNPYGIFPVSLLQKVEMTFYSAAPLINQPENFIITDKIWFQRFKLNSAELISYLDNPLFLWNNESSSLKGQNDRVAYQKILEKDVIVNQSLYLIQTKNTKAIVSENTENKRKIRIYFEYKNKSYNLATTDPNIWKSFSNVNIGEYRFKTDKILCISLGGKFDDGFCYKLVAAVF